MFKEGKSYNHHVAISGVLDDAAADIDDSDYMEIFGCHDYDVGANDDIDDDGVIDDDGGVNDDERSVNHVNDDIDHLSSNDIIIVIRVNNYSASFSSNFIRRLFSPSWSWGAKDQFCSIPDHNGDSELKKQ